MLQSSPDFESGNRSSNLRWAMSFFSSTQTAREDTYHSLQQVWTGRRRVLLRRPLCRPSVRRRPGVRIHPPTIAALTPAQGPAASGAGGSNTAIPTGATGPPTSTAEARRTARSSLYLTLLYLHLCLVLRSSVPGSLYYCLLCGWAR